MNIDTLTLLGILSGVLGCSAFIPYIYSILTGPFPPQRVTMWTWFVLDAMAFISMRDAGSSHTSWVVGAYTVGAFLLSILSIRKGKGGASKTDIVCVIIVVANVIMIFTLGYNPNIVLVLTSIAFLVGSYPTFKQAWTTPFEVPQLPWILYTLSTLVSFLTIKQWDQWQLTIIPVTFLFIQLTILIPVSIHKIQTRKV